ncbi:MAG: hypothetical protein NW237_16545 [Cyanobacteriota bacterium]|nr:hypothetical protein [Cyanobacteriota bacterium]
MTGSREPTLVDVLAVVERMDTELQGIRSDMASSRQELQTEVKRWDERFFEFSRDTANRANTLIASAAIAVIAGSLLLILREGSR